MKSVLKLAGIPVGLAAAVIILAAPVKSFAQGNKAAPAPTPPKNQTPQAPQPPPPAAPTGSYTYVAKPGDSLSVLVRKSVQLYDNEQKDIQLVPASAMYAETNVVQKMGSPLLDIGQTVTINKADLATYCSLGTKLTPSQVAAWQEWADRASFDLPNVTPISGATAAPPKTPAPATPPPSQQGKAPEPKPAPQAKTEQQPKDQKAAQDKNAASNTTQQAAKTDGDRNAGNGNAPWYWWLVGAGTLGVLYYLLSGRQTSTPKK